MARQLEGLKAGQDRHAGTSRQVGRTRLEGRQDRAMQDGGAEESRHAGKSKEGRAVQGMQVGQAEAREGRQGKVGKRGKAEQGRAKQIG